MTLAEAGRQYQDLLEAVRHLPHEDELAEDLEQARRALVHAWLEASYAEPAA